MKSAPSTKMPDLGIFGLEFENNVLIFEICTLKFDYFLNFTLKQKRPKYQTKNAWFGSFCAGIWKRFGHILNQHSRRCLITKLCKETKMAKFGTNNVLFEYFWAGIGTQYCHIWNQHLQERFQNLGSKIPDLGILGLEFQKYIVIL